MSAETTQPPHRHERSAFVGLVALLLAPIIAHGLWRPLLHVLGSAGDASAITLWSLATGAVIAIVRARRRRHDRRAGLIALAVGCVVAVGASVGASLGLGGALTLLCVAGAIAPLTGWLSARLPAALDGLAGRHRGLTALYVALALMSIVSTARLSVFMGDSARVEHQVLPSEEFLETHSCLTAYMWADALADQGVENLYEARWWSGAHGFPPAPPGSEDPYRPFLLDYYAYPPPFLLVTAPLSPFEGSFPAQRSLWFGLNGLFLAAGLWIVARWVGGPGAHRVLLMAPLFFGSLPVLVTLQIGNFQIAVVVMSVLAMVAFDRERSALGGGVLAFAILSKISPGLFGVVLLSQRRWRSAAWTAGFGALLVALSVLVDGLDPMVSFLTYTLSRLSSGEVFSFMDDTALNVITNMSPFGLPFKLRLLGLEVGDPWVLGRIISRIYTVLLVILAIVALRRRGDRRAQAMTWMSLVVLSALQSPFAPGYTLIGLQWALTLLSVEVRSFRGAVALGVLWLLIVVVAPLGVTAQLVQSVFQSALALGVPVWLVFRAFRSGASPAQGEPMSRGVEGAGSDGDLDA